MMVTKFERRLNKDEKRAEAVLKYLQDMPCWWRDLLDYRFKDVSGEEQPLFLAIRHGYLNAYVEGQSVLKIKFDARGTPILLSAKIHHKYVNEGVEGQAYLTFNGKDIGGKSYPDETSLDEWVKGAQKYVKSKKGALTASEKQGVAVIVRCNAHVIDVEMALPANEPEKTGARRVAPRMDIVALEKDGEALKIVFYEAKLFRNPALCAAGDRRPEVLDQLAKYEKWLNSPGREEQVLTAYRRACGLLIRLNAMRDTKVDSFVVQAAQEGSNLKVDSKPRLIVFGYNADEVGPDSPWVKHGHKDKLCNSGYPLLMSRCAEGVRLGLGAKP